MRDKKKYISNLGLRGWMVVENVVFVIGSIMTYELIDFVAIKLLDQNQNSYDPLYGIGMTLPMAFLVSMITISFSRTLYHYISQLTDGISRIAKGEFHTKLDAANGGPLKEVYQNYNLMCDELSSIDSLRNDFVNEFSHEFKTPLASINGFSNLLLEGNCTPEQVTQYLSIIASESERLVALTQSQLLLSKLDSQKIVIDKSRYALDEQIRHCMILLAPDWEKKQLEVSVDLPPIFFYGNPDLLQHVWINLLSNAIKYTPENGEINITARQAPGSIEISIQDTGIGMTDEQMGHIFQKYYRVQNTTSTQGLGLGLPIVKRIVTLSGGVLSVNSSAGEGSIFTIMLPVRT